MTSDRMRRVNELILRELGNLCEREIVSEVDALVTITQVITSPDLHQARVLVSVMGDIEQQRRALHLLRNKRALFQHELATRIKLKYTPVLTFKLDETLAQADRILNILDQMNLEDTPESDANSTSAETTDS